LTRSVFLSPEDAARLLRKEASALPGEGRGKKKKKPGTGATAMKHARAVCAARWPGRPTLEASKSIVWIPDGRGPCRSCGRNLRPISKREDLFECFDILVLYDPIRLIQVTTQTRDDSGGGQTVNARKRKIEELYVDRYGVGLERVEIWSWVARKHFRRWVWTATDWREAQPMGSPLMKRGKSNGSERI